MQKKYEESGKFTVFLSNVQHNNAESVQFLEQAGINFPAYYQVLLPHAPCPGPIPHAVLFDHKGRVVKTGRPDTLIPLVEALVKATPQPTRPILEKKACRQPSPRRPSSSRPDSRTDRGHSADRNLCPVLLRRRQNVRRSGPMTPPE